MTPPNSIVFNEDCMAVMARYPDNHFELAIVDPPYGLGVKLVDGGTWSKKWSREDVAWDVVPNETFFKELFRVSRNQVIWGANYFQLPPTRCFLVWQKPNLPTLADCEYAWTSFDANARIYYAHRNTSELRIHPTQKPVRLYDWILKNYAKPGDKILDTHLGSGSSRIAAYKAGYDFTGCELDKKYFDAQEQRFHRFIAQERLL